MRARFFSHVVLMAGLLAMSGPVRAAESLAPQADDPDLLLWLDATDRATLIVDEQGFVSEWSSKGSRVRCGVTAQDLQRPKFVADAWNGKPALRFDGQDDVLRNVEFRPMSQYLHEKYSVPNAAVDESPLSLEEAITALASYQWEQSRACVVPIDEVLRRGDRAALESLERQLAALLGQGVSPAATDLICRRLAVMGTAISVPALERLLADQERASAAMLALQAIPAAEAGQALLVALSSVHPPVRVGLIHAVGARRESHAVGSLLQLLQSAEPASAAAAGVALAQLGDPQATDALLASPVVAPHTLLTFAMSLAAGDHAVDAQRVYAHLDQVPDEAIRSAVLRGRVMLQPDQAAGRLLAALRGDNTRLRGQAAQLLAYECPEDVTGAVVAEFAGLPTASQATLLGMRWPRMPAAGRTLALQALECESSDIRGDGLHLLTDVGQATDVARLARVAAEDQVVQVRADAELALRHLTAFGTDDTMVTLLSTLTDRARDALIRAVRERRTRGAEPILLQLAAAPDDATRLESLAALQQLGDATIVPPLITRLLAAATSDEQAAADRAVWLCSLRGKGSADPAAPVIEAYQHATVSERALLLPVLGRIGGPRAAEIIHAALADTQPDVRAAAVRGLANWPDATVADRLIQLARQADVPVQRVWALRGYIRVVSLPSTRTAEQTVGQLQDAWQLATRDDERKLILQRLPAIVCAASLAMAMNQINEPALQAEAVQAAAQLAEALLPTDPQAARSAIQKILQVNVDPDLRTRLNRHLSTDR